VNKLSAAISTLVLAILILGFSVQARGTGGGNWIQVTQGEQKLRVYSSSGKLLFSTPVITGRNSKRTLSGTYYIQRLQVTTNPKLRKSFDPEFINGRWNYYQSFVWAPISGSGIGIHDANWWPGWNGRQAFAQSIRKQGKGSHGCLNIPPANIWKLLRYMYPGMRVVIR
jgi:lipoprotein-anchoring transpeptidase ErfK/SrfK